MKSTDEVKCFTCGKWKPVSSCLPMNSWQTYKKFYECMACRGLTTVSGIIIVSNDNIPKDTIIFNPITKGL